MPFVDVAGNEGTPAPAHIDKKLPKLNTGVAFWSTVTLNVVIVAH